MQNTPALTGITLYHTIRACYPRPSHQADQTGYCVGGALMKFYEPIDGPAFPSQHRLMQLLRRANPQLAEIWALLYAGNIIRRNDRQDFAGAWHELERALVHDTHTVPMASTVD